MEHRSWVIRRLIPQMRDRDEAVRQLQLGIELLKEHPVRVLDHGLELYLINSFPRDRAVKGFLRFVEPLNSQIDREVTPDPDPIDNPTVKYLRRRIETLLVCTLTGLPVRFHYPRWMVDIALEAALRHHLEGGRDHQKYHDYALAEFEKSISKRFALTAA